MAGALCDCTNGEGELFAESFANPDIASNSPMTTADKLKERGTEVAEELGEVVS